MFTPLLQVISAPIGLDLGATLDGNWIIISLFKYALWFSSFLYTIFGVVVVRQISVMKRTLITSISPVFTLVGWLHLLISVAVFLLFLLIL